MTGSQREQPAPEIELGTDATGVELTEVLDWLGPRLRTGPTAPDWRVAVIVKKLLDERISLRHQLAGAAAGRDRAQSQVAAVRRLIERWYEANGKVVPLATLEETLDRRES